MVEKRRQSKGYTLLESVIVLAILCLVLIISVPMFYHDVSLYALEEWFISELVCLQQDAYLTNTSYEIQVEMGGIQMKHQRDGMFTGNDFKITKLGRVNQAGSFSCSSKDRQLFWKVWLGMGKVHVQR